MVGYRKFHMLNTKCRTISLSACALEFGLACSKFTPKVVGTPLWRNNAVCDSSFQAEINGNPTATSVVYDNDVREGSLPDITGYPQWGKVFLHNVTRGNSRKITGINTATNTLTTESSSDDWADNDIITIGSQTCVVLGGHSYSRMFDVDVSAEVPSTATAVLLYTSTRNLSGTGASLQDTLLFHPFESYIVHKLFAQRCTAAYQSTNVYHPIVINDHKICVGFGLYGAVTASGMLCIISLAGYWE
ncbi:MAG: hypothetical protein JSW22_03335 [Chloroflexota bacterium]|nr:MAG: hypothetical protein JSW22_03335 [Chloroflexota bacterium]